MKRFSILLVLLCMFTAIHAQENEDFNRHNNNLMTSHEKTYKHTAVVRLLGEKALFFTDMIAVHKNGAIKPEIILGQIKEGTFWYSYFVPFTRNFGFFTGPGLSYSFDKGQGFRTRWQYGFNWAEVSKEVPFSLYLLSNITYDFRAKHWTLGWYNAGISYPLSKRVSIQLDFEGHFNEGKDKIYTATNVGFFFQF